MKLGGRIITATCSKSSNTTEYFRSIGAKKEDVEEFALMLKEKITGLGIEIINYCYIPEDYPYHVDFSHLYSLIVEQYKSTNPLFNEEAQKNSIELDVKSISMIYLLRHGQKPVQIPDVSFLFVTANQSIAQVAFNFHEENYKDKTIPPVLTDVFLGTYIWLSDPMQCLQLCRREKFADPGAGQHAPSEPSGQSHRV